MRPGRVLAVVVSALALAAPASAAGDARPPTVEWRLRDWGGAWRLELRLSERASVAAALTRGGELVRLVPVRPLQAGRARLGLGRLAGGAYRLRVVARDPAGAQTAVERAVRLPALVTVAVSGDLLIHTPVAARALYNGGRRGYRFGPMLARIGPLVRRADLALCHVEHPVGRGPPSGYPRFRAPAALAGAIRSAGFDVCSTASNHTLDYGQPGVDATLGALDRAGVRHTGSWARPPAGRPALLRARGRDRGVRRGHRAHQRDRPSPSLVGRARRPGGDPGRRAPRSPRGGRRRRRQPALGRRVPARAHALPVAPRPAAHRLAGRDGGGGPARPRRPAHPLRQPQARGLRRGEPGLQPVRRLPGRPGRPPRPRRHAAATRGSGRVRYLPTYVRRPDYVVVPAAGASRRRTIAVAGRTARVRPISAR